uniref:N-acetyltransferase domain-containing protein n=1 Tax=Heligmosomoides polygyrus TaxID=6339 RepID=A0A183GPW4_HELPZ
LCPRNISGRRMDFSKRSNNDCQSIMDRLFCYEFTDPQLRIAIEFLKSVFNRADVAYHLEENHVLKPIFVAIIAVHPKHWSKGIGTALLENWSVWQRKERTMLLLSLPVRLSVRPRKINDRPTDFSTRKKNYATV